MYSLRKWIFRPKRTDKSLLAQFFYKDEELNLVAAELDSFDGRKDPERCTALVNQLRSCQDKVLTVMEQIMQELIPDRRADRDFRVKFPDDVLQESLAGQLWFGAECLAAGSSIMNREVESASMRPLARALTRHLDCLRGELRDQCLRNSISYSEKIKDLLAVFDRLFSEFELSYVSAMVPVKTMKEFEMLQDVTVLFCETVERALKLDLLSQEMLDDYDPALMFTIPRLAIICGLLVYPEGPLNPDMDPMNMSEMFRPFQTLLYKIRELLWTLSKDELWILEKSLCSTEEPLAITDKSLQVQLTQMGLQSSGSWEDDGAGFSNGESILGGADQDDNMCAFMSHSQSTITVVEQAGGPHSSGSEDGEDGDDESEDCDQSRQSARQPHEEMEQDVSASARCPVKHQDSEDSGMPSESDRASRLTTPSHGYDLAEDDVVQARRLRQSVSWPPVARRRGGSQGGQSLRDASESETTSSMDLLECGPDGDDRARPVACTHSTGSQEFSFHLPRDTSRNLLRRQRSKQQVDAAEPSGREETARNVIYTSNGEVPEVTKVDNDDMDVQEGPIIAYVTDTLNEFFVTDPTFTGVDPPAPLTPRSHTPSAMQHTCSSVPAADGQPQTVCSCRCRVPHQPADPADGGTAADSSHHVPHGAHDAPPSFQCDTSASSVAVDSPNGVTPVSSNAVAVNQNLCIQIAVSHHCDSREGASLTVSAPPPDARREALDTKKGGQFEEKGNTELLEKNQGYHDDVTPTTSTNTLITTAQQRDTRASNSVVTTSSAKKRCASLKDKDSHSRESQSTGTQAVSSNKKRSARSLSSHGKNNNKKYKERLASGASKLVTGTTTAAATATSGDVALAPPAVIRGHASLNATALHKYADCLEVPSLLKCNVEGTGCLCSCGQSVRCVSPSATSVDYDWDRESYVSSDTSSYNSECHDDEEIALAIQAAEVAARQEARSRFKSSSDLIHRLFVCVSGVADQLQTNYASDLRHILKSVFESYLSDTPEGGDSPEGDTSSMNEQDGEQRLSRSAGETDSPMRTRNRQHRTIGGEPPEWVPDEEAPLCTACKVPFTFVRRRHHCRNCGKIFCGRCSANSVSLPHYGQTKPVRVCNHCFMFQVTPFTVE